MEFFLWGAIRNYNQEIKTLSGPSSLRAELNR
jgi:hypothetical protein